MSKVSVIIPAYNSADFLPEAIASVLNQTYPVFEVIVVDDGSTDNTKEICDRYPSVTYIYQKNQGIVGARNTGLWHSTGEYIIFFDSDDRLLPQAVEIGIKAIAPRREVGFVFGNYVLQSLNPDGTYTTEEIYDNHKEIANYENILAGKLKIQCACVLFRRTVLDKLRGFDPQAKAAEDYNLFLRVAREYPIYFHNQMVFEYRYNGSNISGKPTYLIETIRTHELQWNYVQNSGKKEYLTAYQQGKESWIKLFIERLPYEIMKFTQSGEWIKALGELRLILNYDPKLQFVDREIYNSVYKNLMAQLRKLPFDSSLDYWQKQLAGIPPLLSLPTDRSRPAQLSFQGQSQCFIINQELTKSLNSLSQNQQVDLFTTLLTVFKVLLYRYTGSEDIFLGTPIAKYIHEEIFVNSVIFRTDLSGNPHFQELLQRVKNVVREAEDHQDLPYCLLLEELLPERDPSYPPLFQITFVFEEDVSFQKVELSNLTASPWVLEHNEGKFDLTLFVKETDNQLQGYWVYNTDLFDDETITRLNGHFFSLLTGILNNPETPISQLPLLTPPEQEQILTEWNQTQVDYPENTCFYQLFEQQVQQNPQKIAVEFEGEKITYQELNNRANQLAHYLQKVGVKPDSLVGICVERSINMIVGLLGILKAGGAYIPLDPTYPSERLEYMVEHSQMKILVTEKKLISLIPTAETQVICLDKDWDKIAQESRENPIIQVTADNLAYIIYTSGSTGKPKGVQIIHGAVTNFLTTMKKQPGLTETDILLAITTISFDIAVLELYLPLISGAKIVLVSQETAIDGLKLLKLLTESQATIMQATPATWQLLLTAGWEKSPNLKVLCGGEALTPKLANQLLDKVSSLWNMYGPTEATVWATIYEVSGENVQIDPQKPAISIGKPIGNTQTYILNEYLQPVPIGVPGELYIGGICLARGYLHRQDLTDERFIKNPFSNDDNSRLYKTGDLTRYLPSGNIEYISRIDNQVKIRGFRIELGEIEVLLAQHPEIKQLAVIVREDIPGDKRLVAYIVPHQEKTPTTNELREFLGENLPKYMIPSAFVILESLPLTPNGKIDRRTLLTYTAPTEQINLDITESESSVISRANINTITPTAEILLGIWSEVLGVTTINLDDNFFDLGGHSLLATKLILNCGQIFGIELSLRELFQNPTVGSLAITIDKYLTQGTNLVASEVIIQRANKEIAPLSFAQQRLWFLEQLEPGRVDYHISSAYKLIGTLNIPVLQETLNTIVSHHEVLRTNFMTAENGEPIQVIKPPRSLELTRFDLSENQEFAQEETIQKILQEQQKRPFNLSEDLMIRGCLIKNSSEEHILLLTMHHIASDGWSIGIFNKQLQQVYTAYLQGQTNPLPSLPIQYADFALWQRQWLEKGELERQLQYWKKQLKDANTVLELPSDRPRPAIQTYSGAAESLVLGKYITTGVKNLCLQEKVTLYMTLLSTFGILLSRQSQQEDILIGSPIAGRQKLELEPLIGFFINTLVLRLDLSGNPSFKELLNRTRKTALDAYNYQDLPFEKLVSELNLPRDLSRNPLFQVWFNMLNLEDMSLELTGLKVEAISLESTLSKFDITWYVEEQKEQINLKVVYNAQLFDSERIREMLSQFEQLLNQIIAQPEEKINSYSLVTPGSKKLLPDPRVILSEPEYEPITQLFAQWANSTPEQIAIVQDKKTWTYEELQKTALAIAQILGSSQGQKGDVIAVSGQRSFGLIASMLGVLISGGVLLNIDENLPAQRKQLMLETAKAKKMLYVGEKLPRDLNQTLEIITINPQTGTGDNYDQNITSEPVIISPEDAAYIFFTSGTTGVPKGVLGCHKGLAHFLNWQRNTFKINSQDRVGQLTGLSFDVVLRDIFLPLTSGATLYLPTGEDYLLADRILPWLETNQITLIHTVPTIIQSWLMDEHPEISLRHLRLLFSAGEPLTDTLVKKWRSTFPESGEIINLYGPTETTLAKCFYPIPKEPTFGVQPVGLTLPQTQALVFNSHNQPCGIGETGEIVIRTPFRTLGYINEEKNHSKFVKNPYTKAEKDLLYYTGDRGRYRPDGKLEILGRIDHQVKIRGIRIEPGEISSILNQHPQIKASVIITREDTPGDKRLVVYYVPNSAETSLNQELRQFLKQRLPDYMIPAAFVSLESLPMTPNGKIDRQALPLPEEIKTAPSSTYIAPRNDIERQLTAIWQKILARENVSITDNFFALGGHSLLAVRLVSEIEKTLKIQLSLAVLFQAQTIEELAAILTEKNPNHQWEYLVKIQEGQPTKPRLFCMHAIWGNVLFYQKLAKYLPADQPFYALQAQGLNGQKAPLTSLEAMASNYVQEIQKVQPHGPYYLGGFSLGGPLALEIAQQLQAKQEKIALLAIFDQAVPGYTGANSSSKETQSQTVWERNLHHLKNLMQLELTEQVNYLWQRIYWHLTLGKVSVFYQSYLRYIKRSLPELRILQVAKANHQARRNYQAKIYPGQVTLFLAGDQITDTENAPTLGWEQIATEGVEIYQVPGTTHTTIMEEPQVKLLAEKLTICLEKMVVEPSNFK